MGKFTVLVLGIWGSLAFAVGKGTEVDAAIDAVVKRFMEANRIPGLSVAIGQNGSVLRERGYGFADVENQIAASAQHVYRLASISKPISAISAMVLVEAGKLNLDEGIESHCPAFPSKISPNNSLPVTITPRQLMAHLSGVRHYHWSSTGASKGYDSTVHYKSIQQALGFFKADPLLSDPGEAYHYSTFGYTVLGCVIEGAAKMAFMPHLKKTVLLPAGMHSTRDDNHFDVIPNRSRGYRFVSEQLQNAAMADTSIKVPGGGMVGTASDLVRLVLALEENRLITAATLEAMAQNHLTHSGQSNNYGLGWTLGKHREFSTISHGGAQQGVSNSLFWIPEKRVSVAILSNLEDVRVKKLARQIMDHLL